MHPDFPLTRATLVNSKSQTFMAGISREILLVQQPQTYNFQYQLSKKCSVVPIVDNQHGGYYGIGEYYDIVLVISDLQGCKKSNLNFDSETHMEQRTLNKMQHFSQGQSSDNCNPSPSIPSNHPSKLVTRRKSLLPSQYPPLWFEAGQRFSFQQSKQWDRLLPNII